MKALQAILLVLFVTGCSAPISIVETAVSGTRAAWTEVPTQTPYPTHTDAPTHTPGPTTFVTVEVTREVTRIALRLVTVTPSHTPRNSPTPSDTPTITPTPSPTPIPSNTPEYCHPTVARTFWALLNPRIDTLLDLNDDASELNDHDTLVRVRRLAESQVEAIEALTAPPCGEPLRLAAVAYGEAVANLADARANRPGTELGARSDVLGAIRALQDAMEQFSRDSGIE